MVFRRVAAVALMLFLAACTTTRMSSPARTATEELLISTAADHAIAKLPIEVPSGTRVFIDSSNFEGTDAKYALAALGERILRQGARLVADRSQADIVLAPRAGALSIDQSDTLVGIPSFQIPIPLTGAISLPQLALFAKSQQRGVAKFAIVLYDAKDGALKEASGPVFGLSHKTHWVVALVVGWNTNDIYPKDPKH